MENKELYNKIEHTLQSLNHIKRAKADPFLFTHIMEKMKRQGPPMIKPFLIWQVAASLVIVLGLNVAIEVYTINKKSTTEKSESGYFTNHIYNY